MGPCAALRTQPAGLPKARRGLCGERVIMRICVTGDRGYIGSVVVPMLQRGGHHVVGYDAGWFDQSDFAPRWAGYEQRTGDVRDVRPRDFENVDAVIHLAGLPRELAGWGHGVDRDVRDGGVRIVAAAAKAAGVSRFVHLSTMGSSWARPRDPIGLRHRAPATTDGAERDAEEQVLWLADAHFLPVILRNASPFGSSPRLRLDTLFNALIGAALTHDEVDFIADGAREMPFVHVKDVSRALIVALQAVPEGGLGGCFDIVSRDQWTPISDVARQATAITGTPITLTPAVAAARIGADGIRELCRALTAHAVDPREFSGPKYDRMRTLAGLVTAGGVDLTAFRLEFAGLPHLRFG